MERQLIPEGLARMAPGSELAAVLAGLDIARLGGYDAVVVLQAYARLEAHVQAAKAVVMAEVGLYEVSPCDMKKMAEPDKYSADEIRAALVLTRRSAEREYGFAHDLKARLPQVREALSAGLIDKPRAMVFCDWLEDVPEDLAHAVADRLLPKAGRWTTSELKDKIKSLLIAADPTWARRKYEKAIQQRRVEGVRHADGSASITGHQLPVDQAAAAIARVDAIAQAIKRAGLRVPIDHVRADVFLGLLDGSLAGLDDDAIVALLLERAAHAAATGQEDDYDDQLADHPDDHADDHADDRLDDHADDRLDDASTDPSDGHAADPADKQHGGPVDHLRDRLDEEPADRSDAQAGGSVGHLADRSDGQLGDAASRGDRGPDPADLGGEAELTRHVRQIVGEAANTDAPIGSGTSPPANVDVMGATGFAAGELRVRVSTLMNLDDLPAELAGWGPIHAQLARQLAKRQIGGEWRFAVCDADGQLLFAGITRRRPTGWPRPAAGPVLASLTVEGEAGADGVGGVGCGDGVGRVAGAGCTDGGVPGVGGARRRGIVELQLTLTQLRQLYAQRSELGGWASVIADIARQLDHAFANDDAVDRDSGGPTDGTVPRTTDLRVTSGAATALGPDSACPTYGTAPGTPVPGTTDPRVASGAATALGATDLDAAACGADPCGADPDGRDADDRGAESRPGRRAVPVAGSWAEPGNGRRRFATAGLRRWVQIRDRVCTHPGCRAPATRSELDHTREHARGGLTLADNLAAACAHDHDLRDHGWRVLQPAPGHLIWVSRTGHQYPTCPTPIIDPFTMTEPLTGTLIENATSVTGDKGATGNTGDTGASEGFEIDLPLPSTWEYGPPWMEPWAAEPQPQPGSPPQSSPASKPASDPENDIPPF